MDIRKKLMKFKKNRGYEELLFLQFLLWVTIPVIIMGSISYYVYIRGESAKSSLMLDSYSKQILANYDNTFTSIREYYLDAASRDSFKWLVQQEKLPYHDYQNMKKAQELLQGNYYISGYVKTYNFLNLKYGWVMNNYGTLWYRDLKNEDEVHEFLEEQTEKNNFLYWMNRDEISSPYEELIRSSCIDVSQNMLVVKKNDYDGNLEYVLIVQLDISELEKIAGSYQDLGYDITILDGEETIMQTNPAMTAALLEDGSLKSGIYRGTDGKKYRVSVSSTTANGLQYVVGYDVNRDKRFAAAFFIIAFIVIPAYGIFLLLVKYAVRIVSKPFKALQKYTADQNTQIRELLVSNLIKGELNESRIEAYIQKYGFERFPCYRLIVIRYKKEPGKEMAGDEMELKEKEGSFETRFLLGLPEEILRLFFIAPVYYDKMAVALVGADDEIALDQKAAYAFKMMKDFAQEELGARIAAGISRSFERLSHTNKAYQECLEVLNNRHRNDQESSLALYDDFMFMNVRNNAYDNGIERELCEAVRSGNPVESRRLLSLILQRMEPLGLWGIERNFYLNRLLMELLSVPVKASVMLSDIFEDNQYNVMNLAGRIYDIQELERYIMDEIILPIISVLKKSNQSRDTEIVRKVMILIRESQGDITLSECAEALNYHPSYLSRMIKVENGLNFSDMVNGEKMKVAKYMLLTTSYSISEISEKLNYNNVQNFIRFFKNQAGVTPAKFRKDTMAGTNH